MHSALAKYPRQRALICRAGDLHSIASSVGVGSRDAGKTSAPALCVVAVKRGSSVVGSGADTANGARSGSPHACAREGQSVRPCSTVS